MSHRHPHLPPLPHPAPTPHPGLQHMLTPSTSLISEVGDSWFNTLKLRLPAGCE